MNQRSTITLSLIAIISFVVLMMTHMLSAPILLNRKNAEFLSLLNMTSVGSYSVKDAVLTSGDLKNDGIVRYQVIANGNSVYGIVYEVATSGYNNDLSFLVGIKDNTFQSFKVISSSETPSFGGVFLTNLPTLLPGLSIEGDYLTPLIGASAGVTMTRTGVVNALSAMAEDYLMRTEG
jgi:Na+-translocating ferredoxin:NAD+ oxidoreductase RnfG subunit